MTSTQPYLSMVTTSRNDGHGGDLLGRMNIHINSFIDQCKQYNLDAEIIIVEWNPPSDRPGLKEVLEWPEDTGPVSIRIIQVANELHARLKHSQALPLYQMIAKNVGVRRAKGKFVLATNVDIVFSDSLFRYLGKRKLREDRMYRVDRHDIDAGVPIQATTQERLAYCADRSHVLRICRRGGTEILKDNSYVAIFPHHAVLFVKAAMISIFGMIVGRRFGMSRKHAWDHYRFHRSIGRLHTNACGDFTLLSKKAWDDLQGYDEREMYSFHLDSLFCHAAQAAGYREIELMNSPTYHIEQTEGSAYQPEKENKLWDRLEEAKIGRMTDKELWDEVVALRSGQKSPRYNDENWGFAKEDLEEISV